ncbi:hypothetical protein [Bacteroides sp.]
MKKLLNETLRPLYLLLFIIIGGGLGWTLYFEINNSKTNLNIEITCYLEQAAEENGRAKNKNTPTIGDYSNRPDLLGTYEIRTFRSADTTFTYRHQILDIETEISNGNQFFLLLTDQLNSKDIQILLDSTLNSKKIKAKATIGITSSGYPIKQLSWSNDTLTINKNGYAKYTMTFDFTQIHYTAYLSYDFFTLWKRTNKTFIYLLGIIEVVVSVLLALTFIRKRKAKAIQQEEEVTKEIKRRNYFAIDGKYIQCGESTKKLTPQTLTILQMFLENEEYRVSKEDIKEAIWPGATTQLTNMTTAINRLNDILQEIHCNLEIVTDPHDRDYYLLQPHRSK